jgi:hypothetical protein
MQQDFSEYHPDIGTTINTYGDVVTNEEAEAKIANLILSR